MPGLKPELRNGIYYAVGTFNGRRIRKSLGTRNAEAAAEQCALYEARLWKRHSYGEEAVRTFEEAAESYLIQGGEGRFLPRVMKHFKGRSLASIKPGDIREMAILLYPKAAPATRNRQAIVPAVSVINHGHDRGWCPAVKVKHFEVEKSRKHRPVKDDWLNAFLAQCDRDSLPHLAALVLFMNHTAARVSEAIGLTGENIDLAARTCLLERTKTDEWVTCYLTSELVLRLATLDLKSEQPVFRYTDRSAVNRRIKAVCKRAGLPPRTTHSVGRHSFATNTIAAGVDVKRAMDAGRWKSAKLFMETYVHSEEAGRSVAAVLDRKRGLKATELPQQNKRKRYRFGKKQL